MQLTLFTNQNIFMTLWVLRLYLFFPSHFSKGERHNMEISLRIEAINTYGCRSTRDGRMVYKILWYFFSIRH